MGRRGPPGGGRRGPGRVPSPLRFQVRRRSRTRCRYRARSCLSQRRPVPAEAAFTLPRGQAGEGLAGGPANEELRCPTPPQPSSRASSCSAATGRCGRSGAAAPGRSGSRGTSRTAWTSRSRSSPGRGRPASRAEREAEAAARLRHPACQRAYGFGRDARHVYIAYEYVPGRTFREALRGGELNDADAIEASAQVLEALAHAHARGIVHRDVKPSNVLLADGKEVSCPACSTSASRRCARRRRSPRRATCRARSRTSRRSGSAGGPTMAAADVWAVGVMLWEALAGRPPVLAQLAARDRAGDRGRRAAARGRAAGPAEAAPRGGRPGARHRPGQAAGRCRLLAATLRLAGRKRRRKTSGPTVPLAVPAVLPRVAPAVLAGLLAGWAAFGDPVLPLGWGLGLGALALGLTLADAQDRARVRPRRSDPAARERGDRSGDPLRARRGRPPRRLVARAAHRRVVRHRSASCSALDARPRPARLPHRSAPRRAARCSARSRC